MSNFNEEIARTIRIFRNTNKVVHTERWQGVDIKARPEMATHEIRHHMFRIETMGLTNLEYYQRQIEPNLPWADDHFVERVSGRPINPGEQWKHWPYAHSAEKFLVGGKFNHNYMERYWPRWAGLVEQPTIDALNFDQFMDSSGPFHPHEGIYNEYGDLAHVVDQLVREPLTRQAILPVFFPEDTGARHGGRVPCSLFYQFLVRDGCMDITYMLRSCDLMRHFRDDIYLTVRLLLWVLDECRKKNEAFRNVVPGQFNMMITSLHVFRNDYRQMFGGIA